jgi:NADPH-dependent 2,4-dienoyl-CoA reductase/sulfur reductase-like enzyme/nitrite reductase/ring-hydroxylating ferredoxin subunit
MEGFTGPDFGSGLPVDRLPDGGMIQGKISGEDVILARTGDEFFAVGAGCTHYHGPLVKGLIAGDQLRCPLHHACFSLRTGEALRAPAFDPIPCWRVERIDNIVFVREKLSTLVRKAAFAATNAPKPPASVVIIGGGAAGLAAAEMLRREGYDGSVTMISADDFAPYDRPNVSKDYLAGPIPDEWMPLRLPNFYKEQRIDLLLRSRVSVLDVRQKQVQLEGGRILPFEALLMATGAEPIKLALPGASDTQLYYVRTFDDSRALIEKAASAKQTIVVGASFIGLEVAASLRARGLNVHVVAPEQLPLERILGSEVGWFIRTLHEAHGVIFHLGETITRLDGHRATLSGGATVDADLLVVGAGVKPSLSLAERAGLKVDRGVVVNEYLETSAPGIFAAGDIARWPDAHSGQFVRVEHWVVAERQGQTAARNMLGCREKFDAVPFFWSQHYDVVINYVGHAESWDEVQIEGSLEARDCAVSYKRGSRLLAVATISRDLQSLRYEVAMESGEMQP